MAPQRSFYRCSMCSVNYPLNADYRQCLRCGGECWSRKGKEGDTVLSPAELLELKARRQREVDSAKSLERFERFCDERDRKLLEADVDALKGNDLLYVGSFFPDPD